MLSVYFILYLIFTVLAFRVPSLKKRSPWPTRARSTPFLFTGVEYPFLFLIKGRPMLSICQFAFCNYGNQSNVQLFNLQSLNTEIGLWMMAFVTCAPCIDAVGVGWGWGSNRPTRYRFLHRPFGDHWHWPACHFVGLHWGGRLWVNWYGADLHNAVIWLMRLVLSCQGVQNCTSKAYSQAT